MEKRFKTKRESFYNEEAHCWDSQWVDVPYYRYTDEEKIKIVSEHVQGKMAQEIISEYHLSSKQVLFSWLDKYLNEQELVSLSGNQSEDSMAQKNPEERIKELGAKNRRLEKALALEKLRSKAFDTMINIAEGTFNIPIRKNLAPNSKSAPQGVLRLRSKHSLPAVWL